MPSFPAVGEDYGRYRVLGELGRGGMGVVFEAEDAVLNRRVALKVLNPVFSADPDYRDRFAREAATLARLDSPLIVHIYDYGEHEGTVYLVTQILIGGDLAQHLARYGPLPTHTGLSVTADVCEALSDAHESGVIHRDVKPSNVFLRQRSGRTSGLLGDFGIATTEDSPVTRTGSVIGSTNFMAPERHQGARADERSDIYAAGCLLWCVLEGRAPYQGTDVQVAMDHISAPIPQFTDGRPAQDGVNAILRRSLAKRPDERYATAAEMAADLRDITSRLTPQRQTAPDLAPAPDQPPVQRPSAPVPPPAQASSPQSVPAAAPSGWAPPPPADLAPAPDSGQPAPLPEQTQTQNAAPPQPAAPASTLVRNSSRPSPPPSSPPSSPRTSSSPAGDGSRHKGMLVAAVVGVVLVLGVGVTLALTRGKGDDHGGGGSSGKTTATDAVTASGSVTRTMLIEATQAGSRWGLNDDDAACVSDGMLRAFPDGQLTSLKLYVPEVKELTKEPDLSTTDQRKRYADVISRCGADASYWLTQTHTDVMTQGEAQRCLETRADQTTRSDWMVAYMEANKLAQTVASCT